MPHLDYFISRLHAHANKTIHLCGKAQIAAGLIRGKEIFNMSTNYFNFHHAEQAVFRKPFPFEKRQQLRHQAKAS